MGLKNKADFSFCGRKECANKYKAIKDWKIDYSKQLEMWLECSTCLDIEIKERQEKWTLDNLSRLKQNLVKLLAETTFK